MGLEHVIMGGILATSVGFTMLKKPDVIGVGNLQAVGRLAKVNPTTKIEMLEYDLAPMKTMFGASQWNKLFGKLLEKGALLDLFLQKVHPESEDLVAKFKSQHPTSFNVWDYSEIPDNVMTTAQGEPYQRERFLQDKTHIDHYALFTNPNQIWFELDHTIDEKGKSKIGTYNFFSDGRIKRFPTPFSPQHDFSDQTAKNHEYLTGQMKIIKEHSKPMDIASV